MRWFLKVLAALALAIAVPASAQAPKRVALVIGNAGYASGNVLTNPPNDARLVAQALRQAGFQTVEQKRDLGVQAFGRALRDFRVAANGADVAFVYYAGHGIEGNGKNWLIPTDAVLASEFDLTYEAISLDQVLDAVSGARMRVVVLDACRDNPLGRSWRRGTRAVTRGLNGVDADDVLVIFAAAPGQVASDGQGAANSPFAAALARRLPEAGLPIQLLGGRVRDDVLRATGNVQRPFVSASVTGEPFYLVPGVARATEPATAPSPEAVELAVWQGALAANTRAAFEDYLRQYPTGRFAGLAQQNLQRFSPTVAPASLTSTSHPLEVRWRRTSSGTACNPYYSFAIVGQTLRWTSGQTPTNGGTSEFSISGRDAVSVTVGNTTTFRISGPEMTVEQGGRVVCTFVRD